MMLYSFKTFKMKYKFLFVKKLDIIITQFLSY